MRLLRILLLFSVSLLYSINPPKDMDFPTGFWDEMRLQDIGSEYGDTGWRNKMTAQDGMRDAQLTFNIPVLLGQYSDATTYFTAADFQNMLFDNNSTGTMKEYYTEISHGNFTVDGTADGWYQSSYTMSDAKSNTKLYVSEIAQLADPDFDYSQFDNDGPDNIPNSGDDDGYVDGIAVVYSGCGAEWYPGNDNLWPHMSSLGSTYQYTTGDASANGGYVIVNSYFVAPELSGGGDCNTTTIRPMGVYAHEFGHVLGLPDLYDRDDSNGDSEGIGNWCLMAGGSWNGTGGDTPAHLSAWCKQDMGWLEPTVLAADQYGVSIPQAETNAFALKIWEDEYQWSRYFLVENRQQTGFDAELPGNGLMIYHVDENKRWGSNRWSSGSVNDDHTHKFVDVEEADGAADMDNEVNRGDDGDTFPGSTSNTSFSSTTNPNSNRYDGSATTVSVTNISSSSSSMTADITLEAREGIAIAYDSAGISGWGYGYSEAQETWGGVLFQYPSSATTPGYLTEVDIGFRNADNAYTLYVYDALGPNGTSFSPGNLLLETTGTLTTSGWASVTVDSILIQPGQEFFIAVMRNDTYAVSFDRVTTAAERSYFSGDGTSYSDMSYTSSGLPRNVNIRAKIRNNTTTTENLTYVPDDNFEQALIDLGYDDVIDDYVLTANISVITDLDISSKEISDLTGIDDFTALTDLDCEDNLLTSLDISNNTALTWLHCFGNQLTALDVSNNTALTELRCGQNALTSLDVSANTSLTLLRCQGNQLTALDLNTNTALTDLKCQGNQLTSLDLSNNTGLTNLWCQGNQLTALDLSNNTVLDEVHCGANEFSSLNLSSNILLNKLYCSDSNQLTSLNLSNNAALTLLWCYNNSITDLDVSANTSLTNLHCYNNELTSLDVSANTALTDLHCSGNQLTSLDLNNNTALDRLICGYNPLTALDLSNNTVLDYLNCFDNELTSLDVSTNTALTELRCGQNVLTSLDVSANTSLILLRCQTNQLTALDVSTNTALTNIHCYNNSLSSLDVSANTALTDLRCQENQLTALDVSANTALTNLMCFDNPDLYCIQVADVDQAQQDWADDISNWMDFSTDCDIFVFGCTDSLAQNYNSDATWDDGSCSGYPDNGDYSLGFDGDDDYVLVSDDQSLNPTSAISISYWVKIPTNSSVSQFVVNKGVHNSNTAVDDSYIMRIHSTGAPAMQIAGGGNNWIWIESSQVVNDGEWHHVAFVFDRPTSYFYIDGVYDDGGTYPSFDYDLNNTAENVYLGAGFDDDDGIYAFIDGSLDDITIWNRALTQEEIQSSMSLELSGDEDGLAGYWKFNAGADTIAYDHSGNANHGDINGASWIVSPTTAEISVSPGSLSEELYVGDSSTQVLTILNNGDADLVWTSSIGSNRTSSLSLQQVVSRIQRRSGVLDGNIIAANNQPVIRSGFGQTAITEPDQIARTIYNNRSDRSLDVALLFADYPNWALDVANKLIDTDYFSSVTYVDVRSATPTVNELAVFDAVLVWSDYGFGDAVELGNNLADYVDAGGGVVCAMFALASNYQLRGRFHEDNYWSIYPDNYILGQATLGTIYDNNHPILDNVESFDGGSRSFRLNTTGISDGATRVADWSDGTPLIATKQINGVNRADLGFFPPSSDIYSDGWDPNTNGDLLMANSLLWVSGQSEHEWLSALPDSGIISPGSSQEIEVEFNTVNLDSGTYSAQIQITSNDEDEPQVNVPVTLTANIPYPNISVTPDSLTENLFVGESSVQVMTISNEGVGDLEWAINTSSRNAQLLNPHDIPDYDFTPPTGSPYTEYYNNQGNNQYDKNERSSSNRNNRNNRNRTSLDFEDSGDLGVELGGQMTWNGDGGGHLFCQLNDGDDYIYFYEPTYLTSFEMNAMPWQDYNGGDGFHQDIYAYDADGNTVWAATVDLSDYADWSNWLTVNVETANISTLHFIAPANEPWYAGFWPSIDNMVINENPQSDWLYTDPISGTVAPGSSQDVVVSFDATNIEEGNYATNLSINSNDPVNPVINVPISLDVLAPLSMYYVTTTGSDSTGIGTYENPFATIQKGIDAASSGDTVSVAAGTYVENINYNGKNIAVLGENRETTIIDGGGVSNVVRFENDENENAVLSGFTLTNGRAVQDYIYGRGGGICILSSPTLSDLTIIGNTALGGGGGMYIHSTSSSIITDVDIIDNITEAWRGGGIYYYGGNAILSNMNIIGNQAGNGGGIGFQAVADLAMNNIVIAGNTAGEGAGILLNGGNFEFENLTIAGNISTNGSSGGITFADNYDFVSELILSNSIVYDNSGDQQIIFEPNNDPHVITVTYSNIQGAEDAILTNDNGTVIWGDGNIDADPLFCEPDSGNYHIAGNSPSAGTGEDGADMGAFGVGCGDIWFPPTIAAIQDTSMDEDSELMLQLSAESAQDYDIYFEAQSDTSSVYVYTEGDTLHINLETDWNGSSEIIVVAYSEFSDESNDTASFTLTVNPVDDLPFVDGHILPRNYPEDFGVDTVAYLPDVFVDIDGDLTFSYLFTDGGVVAADVSNDYLVLSSLVNASGTTQLLLTASNPMRASVTDTVDIEVWPLNDPPVVDIPDQLMMEDSEIFLDISGYMSDDESEELWVYVEYVSEPMNEYLDAHMHGSDTLHLIAHDNWNGAGEIEVNVSDGELETSDLFALEVRAVNDEPMFHNLHALVGVGMDFHVPIHVSDIDMDSLVVSLDDSWDYPDWLSLADNPYALTGMAVDPASIHFPLHVSDGQSTVTDTFHLSAQFFNPRITSVTDVPDDQGGQVQINFLRSFFDQTNESNQMYTVFRHDMVDNVPEWVVVGSGAAIGDVSYTYEVSTLMDSTSEGDGMTEFKVVASMDDGHFHSPPESGYSVDNIAPGVPQGLMAVLVDDGIQLTWEMSADEDFQYYMLEKSADEAFTEPEVFEMIDIAYLDLDYVLNESNYYRLAAVDHAGNMSDYSDVLDFAVLATDLDLIPEVFALHQNYPNPFNPTTQIKYDLPEDAMVSITIYDVMGRRVKSLVSTTQSAGYRSIQWDATNNLGEPVSAGMYIYMIQAGQFTKTKKMVLLK